MGLDTYNHRYFSPTPGNKWRDPATVLSVVDLVRKELNRPDVPSPFSPTLEQAVLPQVDDGREACRELLEY